MSLESVRGGCRKFQLVEEDRRCYKLLRKGKCAELWEHKQGGKIPRGVSVMKKKQRKTPLEKRQILHFFQVWNSKRRQSEWKWLLEAGKQETEDGGRTNNKYPYTERSDAVSTPQHSGDCSSQWHIVSLMMNYDSRAQGLQTWRNDKEMETLSAQIYWNGNHKYPNLIHR
jgi:hypothetical protein